MNPASPRHSPGGEGVLQALLGFPGEFASGAGPSGPVVLRAKAPPSSTALLQPWEKRLQGRTSLWVPVPRLSLVCPALPWLWSPVPGHPGSPWSPCSVPRVLTQARDSVKTTKAGALTPRARGQDIEAAGVSA